jgi:tetratricopeptide (TPR) repeat protein
LLATIFTWIRQYEKATAAGQQSVALNPNGALGHINLGSALCYAGKIDEGIDQINQAIRLNPFPNYFYFYNLGRCYRQNGLYNEALAEFKKALQRSPENIHNHMSLAAIYALLDRHEEAEAAANKVLEINPKFSVKRSSKTWPYKNQNDIKLFADALRKAGLPD